MFKRISLRVRLAVPFVGVMVVLLVANTLWRSHILQEQAEHEMLETTEVLAEEMNAIWDFMEINQGQFIRNEDGTYNLYCVVAAKAVSRLFTTNNTDDFVIHYTNLTTRKPDDAPDAFETQALTELYANPQLKAYYALNTDRGGPPVFRYVEPLYITESCLECHGDPAGELDVMGYAKEGLRKGDIAGAASIIMPADTYMANVRSSILQETGVFVLITLAGLAVIFWIISRFVTTPMERQNRQLEEDNRYKSDFLAIMSHEIRTPLTSILAFADIWSATNKPRSPEEESIMREMRINSQILLAMVNNILEMARVEAGRAELALEPVDLSDLFSVVRGSMGFLAEKKRVSIRMDIARDMPVVIIDAEKVRRILENLISNAIKFVDEGGLVQVGARYDFDVRVLTLTVEDDGCGIKPEDRPFVFDRFTQGHDSTAHRSGGSGLGLAVVRELAELHGGTVELECPDALEGAERDAPQDAPQGAPEGAGEGAPEGTPTVPPSHKPRGCVFIVRLSAQYN
jgi:signal transduction histidine kinase